MIRRSFMASVIAFFAWPFKKKSQQFYDMPLRTNWADSMGDVSHGDWGVELDEWAEQFAVLDNQAVAYLEGRPGLAELARIMKEINDA